MVERMAEGLIIGAMGAVLGWFTVGIITDGGLQMVGAFVGGANGAITGVTGMYSWNRAKGWLFFLLDSTWGLLGNTLALGLHALNRIKAGSGFVGDMGRRTNRHVYERGIGLRRGFALALGYVISNAGGTVGLRGEVDRVAKRRKFVVAHEGVHVLQNRSFGPLYQIIYVGWMAAAVPVALVTWLVRDRERLGQIIETMAYYNNPFEYWAYKNDRYWPPKGAHKKYAWGSPKNVDVA